ncbi:(Na+)-NQR maturation NqrM [Motilimonas sp. 1_MG-2023]|uniref:(Na+)-NQR maturation NqrM n=1 Tax=Motilimonas sp. 1_MG-2023 TaxID=3062672 RepID=UPI0026E18C8F|nr:(Na+)-NQR maturation NqrM [Motilimonas sp. 1_MG-2023]MDO6527104.1 (Na+)-NQR maturation NqrM [Motilimonas sp. 1_MG-2023]
MEYALAFVIFLFISLAMALGVIFKRRAIQGSCGGLASIDIEPSCDCQQVCAEHRVLYQIQEAAKAT